MTLTSLEATLSMFYWDSQQLGGEVSVANNFKLISKFFLINFYLVGKLQASDFGVSHIFDYSKLSRLSTCVFYGTAFCNPRMLATSKSACDEFKKITVQVGTYLAHSTTIQAGNLGQKTVELAEKYPGRSGLVTGLGVAGLLCGAGESKKSASFIGGTIGAGVAVTLRKRFLIKQGLLQARQNLDQSKQLGCQIQQNQELTGIVSRGLGQVVSGVQLAARDADLLATKMAENAKNIQDTKLLSQKNAEEAERNKTRMHAAIGRLDQSIQNAEGLINKIQSSLSSSSTGGTIEQK